MVADVAVLNDLRLGKGAKSPLSRRPEKRATFATLCGPLLVHLLQNILLPGAYKLKP